MHYNKSEIAYTLSALTEKLDEAVAAYERNHGRYGYALSQKRLAETNEYVSTVYAHWLVAREQLGKHNEMTQEDLNLIISSVKTSFDGILNLSDALCVNALTSTLAVQAAIGNGNTAVGQA